MTPHLRSTLALPVLVPSGPGIWIPTVYGIRRTQKADRHSVGNVPGGTDLPYEQRNGGYSGWRKKTPSEANPPIMYLARSLIAKGYTVWPKKALFRDTMTPRRLASSANDGVSARASKTTLVGLRLDPGQSKQGWLNYSRGGRLLLVAEPAPSFQLGYWGRQCQGTW